MKIIKQLSETDFVVHIPLPENRSSFDSCGVAHGYFTYFGKTTLSTDHTNGTSLYGPNAWCSNVVMIDTNVQINIREMGEVIMPYLNNHKYLKEEHYSKYSPGSRDIRLWPTEDKGDYTVSHKTPSGKMVTIPYEVYCELKGLPYNPR